MKSKICWTETLNSRKRTESGASTLGSLSSPCPWMDDLGQAVWLHKSFTSKMRELAGWFSTVFLDLTFHYSKIFGTDSFLCCKMKFLTILTGQLSPALTTQIRLGACVQVSSFWACGSPVLKLTDNNDRLPEVNKLVLH